MRLKAAAVLLIALSCAWPSFAAPTLFGFALNTLDVNASLMVIGSVPPVGYGDVSPIVQLIGISLPVRVSGPYFLEPMLEFFGTNYEWTGTYGTAVPAQAEAGGGFFTLGTLISMHAGASFPVSPVVSLGGSVGLDLLLRFPIEFTNMSAQSVDGRLPALGYFFDKVRFLYPETRLFLRWQISDAIGLVVNLRAFYPLFHLWDGLGQSFFDQFMFSGGLGFAIRLGPGPTAATPPPAEAAPAAEPVPAAEPAPAK